MERLLEKNVFSLDSPFIFKAFVDKSCCGVHSKDQMHIDDIPESIPSTRLPNRKG